MDRHGHAGVVSGIFPISGSGRIFGRAVTVELGPSSGQVGTRHLGTAAIEAAVPGDIIVVGHRGRTDCAGWGGNLSLAAHLAGVAGLVIDGACRDITEAAALGFPIFGRAATPRTARGRVREVAYQQPVIVSDVVVRPGDLVIADSCGVVVVGWEHEETVMSTAVGIVVKEEAMAAAIRAGTPVSEAMGASYESMIQTSPEGHQ
jgi:regulator of RNase E activity RraA